METDTLACAHTHTQAQKANGIQTQGKALCIMYA